MTLMHDRLAPRALATNSYNFKSNEESQDPGAGRKGRGQGNEQG